MMMESKWRGGARASRSKGNNNSNVVCRKHPKHMQSPGVCSICLNEKLSQLMSNSDSSSSSSRAARSRSSSTSLSSYASSLSSSNASSCSSPARVFNKSRSIGIGKRGFWSKLLPRKTRGFLMHSRTTRERVVTAFH